MDITKINFNEAKYNVKFEDLDVNNDNVINEADATAATDNSIKTTINKVLADADEESELTDDESSKGSTKTAADIEAAAKDILTKYPVSGTSSGDSYSMKNPEMEAFKKAMDDGIIESLNEKGFSAEDIIDVIEKAFPTIGIKNNENGGFNCPYGHDADAKALYDEFTKQIGTITSPEIKALQSEIKTMNADIASNNAELNKLKGSITILTEAIESAVEKAIKESEEIEAEQKENAATIVKEELNKYSNSDGEMTYDSFQSNLSSRLDELQGDGSSKLSKVIMNMLSAENNMSILKGYITTFSSLVDANKTLSKKVEEKTGELKDLCEEPNCDANRCDPIGFAVDGKRFDFFVDKDNNGKLSNEKEFLGADDGWNEMSELDANNDGQISADEMKDLKVVITDEAGNQKVEDAANIFGASDSINLASYESVNEDFDNGNTLLGTFSLTFNGKEVSDGYNTLDKVSWLDDNYDFSDKDEGINRFAQGNTKAEEVLDYSKELSDFGEKYSKLETKMDTAWSAFNISRSDVSSTIIKGNKSAAGTKAESIESLFKAKLTAQEQEKA